MKFTKMNVPIKPNGIERIARALSDRHFGVGADGVLCICSSSAGDFAMRMFNADGSEGKMCGNGVRCIAKYLYDKGLTDKLTIRIETMAGIRTVDLCVSDGTVAAATADMGAPVLGEMANIYVNDKTFTGIDISMGNPHFVIFVPNVRVADVPRMGEAVERHPRFPQGVNVEFVSVLSRERVAMRVWERGSGETLACGTGTCAAVAAARMLGRVERSVVVELPGGELGVMFREHDGHMLLTGPVVTVFEGWWQGKW